MAYKQFSAQFLPAVETALHSLLEQHFQQDRYADLRYMMAYHLGWEGEGSGARAQGKRIRPQITLLCCAAAGGDWHNAIPAATAVELIHNFSLIHDDIEDRSELRHGRKTVWAKWGEAQAINTGDAMLTLAHLALIDLDRSLPAVKTLAAAELLQTTCLDLTRGQFLDISFETKRSIPVEDYWPMVGGKTAALLAGCAKLGSLVGGADEDRQDAFYRFGYSLGLAFQAQDDALGIWGDAALLGKSIESDLVSGKKTLPVVFALVKNNAFAQRWLAGPITIEEVPQLAEELRDEGAKEFTLAQADRLTTEALEALHEAVSEPTAGQALEELALDLLKRNR
ncbi:geranylgeranyl pyrophosphate synthase [Longilinea arvoryzae]|uniref:Geranylgeranyl pyrophosphate synthase n=1 Tax=Longilinea arvoryzae TaxID=360412 RepID=A0A0S7BIP6_9CHLR|nr:polyprenyl synthetase family protein [Longilinea arvoryzae]GAP14980.1 geranylgeranyl pyrophosphate synthase [Longilinea arvoryzae]